MKVPPALSVPAPVKIIWELVPAEVILPDAVTVPVEILRTLILPVVVEPDKVIVVQINDPAPTSSVNPVVEPLGGRASVTPPVSVTEMLGLIATILLVAAVVEANDAALTFPVIVAVPPVFVTEIAPVVVNPPMLCVVVPVIEIALEPPVKVPLLTKLPAKVNPRLAVARVAPLLIVNAPFEVVATPNVLVPLPEMVRL
jgi:hypothetical protein